MKYLHSAQDGKYTYQDIINRFESVNAPKYGIDMSAWIPDYAYAHRLLLDSVFTQVTDPRLFADLGAGTGRLSRLLLEVQPNAQITLIDVSTNMLQEAERQLGTFARNCQFEIHDIFDSNFNLPSNSLDCVVSAFAICHAQGESIYRALYQRIYNWLKPGGYFGCYDHVAGDSSWLTALNALGWARLLSKSQSTEQVSEAVISTYQEDSPLSLKYHLQLLQNVGFSVVDVLYKRDIFAIYGAVK